MSDEKARDVIRDLPDGRKVYIEKKRPGGGFGLTIGVGAEDPAGDELVNLPDEDDGQEN